MTVPEMAAPRAQLVVTPFLRSVAAACPALAVVVLLHEGGHLFCYWLFGFPDPVLHSQSAAFATQDAFWELMRAGQPAAASAMHPLHQVGIAVAAGIGMTIVSIVLAIISLRFTIGRAFWLAVGLLAPMRFLVGVPAVLAWISNQPSSPTSDEGAISLLLGVHPGPLALSGLLVMLLTWMLVAHRLQRVELHPTRLLAATICGAICGGVVYARWVGPWILGS
jgi:hypothetical protein